jgi:hypothetical protein
MEFTDTIYIVNSELWYEYILSSIQLLGIKNNCT